MTTRPARKPRTRCAWVPPDNALYAAYHDDEWGVPVTDDRKLFEFLLLESAQAGLSWITILRKREHYRRAFAGFDPRKVAQFGLRDEARLLKDVGIVRNRLKIAAAINNAKRFLEIQKEYGSFAVYIWGFVDGWPVQNTWTALKELPAKTETAERLSQDLKKRGFKFLGPTIIYAHMQATGMVNDHVRDCFRYQAVKRLGKQLQEKGRLCQAFGGTR